MPSLLPEPSPSSTSVTSSDKGGNGGGDGKGGGAGGATGSSEGHWRFLGLKISKDDVFTITAALVISYGIRW